MSEIRPLEAEYATINDGRTYEQYVEDDAQEFLADLEGDGYDPSHLIRNMIDAYGMSQAQAEAAWKRYREEVIQVDEKRYFQCTNCGQVVQGWHASQDIQCCDKKHMAEINPRCEEETAK